MKKQERNFFRKKVIVKVLILFILSVLIFSPAKPAKAQAAVGILSSIPQTFSDLWKNAKQLAKDALNQTASMALNRTIRNTLNRLAYDAAEDLMSGGEGQQPKIVTKNWGDYFKDIGDAAAGDFLDGLNSWTKMDLCEPNLDVKLGIGLGLERQIRPAEPNCKASTMVNAWKDEYQRLRDMQSEDFMQKFMGFLKPEANSLTVSLSVFQGLEEKKTVAYEDAKNYTTATQGESQDATTDAGDQQTDLAGRARWKSLSAEEQLNESIGKFTGNALVDAANVFLNQLALKAYEKGMKALMDRGDNSSVASNVTRESNFLNPEADSSSVNRAKVQAELREILEPRFDTRGDFDILATLSTCPDLGNTKNPISADNCVIDEDFREAIADQKTVGEAMESGYLHKDWVFGGAVISSKINYNEGYSARSLMILRKYRIIPLGWEEALNRAYKTGGVTATLQDLVSCFDPNDKYNTFSQGFPVNAGWCQGLVDPKWVLKAPSNYCAKLGNGYVLSEEVMPATGDEENREDSQLHVTRNTDYCADSQSCIKEKSDGTCEAYGYCTEEKRTWNFNSDDCEPVYNTCETFKKVGDGQSVSYLKNTLNYAGCDADSVGCKSYADTGIYFADNDNLKWNSSSLLFLNHNTESCIEEDEGCDELIRIRDNYGHNFITNGNFEQTDEKYWWNCEQGTYDNCLDSGYRSLKSGIIGTNYLDDLISDFEVEVGPSDYNISGNTYTFSFYAKDCSDDDAFGFKGTFNNNPIILTEDNLTDSTSWKYYRLSYTFPAGQYLGNTVRVFITPDSECTVDQLKLELGNKGTVYTEYGYSNLFYQKMLPEYMWETCYVNPYSGNTDFSLKNDAPDVCDDFARMCNEDEVGCDMYTSVKNPTDQVAAKVATSDYCREECNNYDLYIQQDNYLFSKKTETFILETADTCSASVVGCSEFTNLDKLAQGGEAKEYYKTLRQCIEPASGSCANFYTWEGSAESGYQLKSYTLKTGAGNEPAVTEIDNALCNETIFKRLPGHPEYNPDCYEFYNTDGDTSYHLYSRTITCSDNCHPYRLSDKNIDYEYSQAECNALGNQANWNSNEEVCYYCKNNGKWDSAQQACIYQAVPGLGESCLASDNKCREYNGNSGSNVRIVSSYDFNVSKEGWYTPSCYLGTVLSSESLNRGGKSLKFQYVTDCGETPAKAHPIIKTALAAGMTNPIIVNKVGTSVRQGRSYVIKFLAKATEDINLKVYFENQAEDTQEFNVLGGGEDGVTVIGDNNWHSYELNLASLDHSVGPDELLVIKDANNPFVDDFFYIDDIVLTEVTDKYYLIADSWNTPESCYYDIIGNYQGVNYNLGCSSYLSGDNSLVYLRQFSKLCQDSAVGCDLMVDTKNTSDYLSSTYNDEDGNGCDNDGEDCVEIEADEYIYAVYSPDKTCSEGDKGCQRLGASYNLGDGLTFRDIYLKNNPDKYDSILCSASTVDCESWINDSGNTVFFKDPGEQVCEWRPDSTGQNWSWFKKTSKRCDGNNNKIADEFENICVNSSDCYISNATLDECSSDEDCRLNVCNNASVCTLSGVSCDPNNPCDNTNICVSGHCANSCIGATEDFECDVESEKTFGFGGRGNLVYQPSEWTGLCEASASTCTEYIDPLSSYVVDEIVNPTFSDMNGDGQLGDFWNPNVNNDYDQNLALRANKIYTFGLEVSPNLVDDISAIPDNIISIQCGNGATMRQIKTDNTLDIVTQILGITGEQANNHINFKFISPQEDGACKAHIYTNNLDENQQRGIKFILKESVIDYRLAKELDRNSCNGITDIENGCILFNERTTSGDSYKELTWTAYDSYISFNKAPQPGGSYDVKNANSLIKVRPDRVCASWLACESRGFDKNGNEVCYDVIDCDSLDVNGNCANRLESPEGIRTFNSSRDKNASGYSLLGSFFISNMKELGNNLDSAHYDFETGEDQSFTGDDIRIIIEPIPDPSIAVSYPAHGLGFLEIKGSQGASSSVLAVQRNKKYIINYLVNSSSLVSGDKVVMSIMGVDNSGNEDTMFQVEHATRGWERKVYEFTPTFADKIRIKFNTKTGVPNNPFYIDDVNIETALVYKEENGNKDYISKSCRLYPKQDSLSCQSTAQSVIANGWEGYCLQRDPYHPDICLMWYPVDVISSQTGSTAEKNSGYKGKTPLWYCTEADANFVLAERRLGVEIGYTFSDIYNNGPNGCPEYDCDIKPRENFSGGTWNCPDTSTNWPQKIICEDNCDSKCRSVASSFYAPGFNFENGSGCDNCQSAQIVVYCASQEVCDTIDPNNNNFSKNWIVSAPGNEYQEYVSPGHVEYYCGSNEYVFIHAQRPKCAGTTEANINRVCLPDGQDLLQEIDNLNFEDPDFEICQDPQTPDNNIDHFICERGQKCNQIPRFNEGWYPYEGDIEQLLEEIRPEDVYYGESIPGEDKLKVYDYNTSSLYNLNQYEFECNKMVQVVESNGNNTAWAVRSQDSTVTSTPAFFLNPYYTDLQGYGYDASDPPFGSASLQSGWNDNAVNFRVRVNYQNSTSFAGLPYGCNDQGTGSCARLGFCSDAPEVLCIYNDNKVDELVCANGTCELLGLKPSYTFDNAKEILKTFFLKTYSTLEFNDSKWVADNDPNSGFDFSYPGSPTTTSIFAVGGMCEDGERTDQNAWCYIPPEIENIRLEKDGATVDLVQEGATSGYDVVQSGEYQLKFNTIIDREQAPLGDIIIDWGEGPAQTISNQDYHPDPDFPHIITHSYINPSGLKNIKIQISDNWGFNRCCAPSHDTPCTYRDLNSVTCPDQCPCDAS
ncbi:MAG: hypothetical protein K9M44_01205 [Candidatus Pacebacteria bacterium]|nr:hypothetical protein [Candidatus Paceibacterota bacterium]